MRGKKAYTFIGNTAPLGRSSDQSERKYKATNFPFNGQFSSLFGPATMTASRRELITLVQAKTAEGHRQRTVEGGLSFSAALGKKQ